LHALAVDGRYLVERNATVYTPSASVMRYARQMRRPDRTRAVALADSRPDRPLLHARDQVARIGRLYAPDTRLVFGQDATVDGLVAAAAEAAPTGLAVLHLACHGEFNRADPQHSGLWLASTDTHTACCAPSTWRRCHCPPTWSCSARARAG
jgi:CHAT domain-containing protein